MKKLKKEEAKSEIEKFFEHIEDKSPREVRKIKKLAMHYNIKLGSLRKKFCKKCYSSFPQNAEIRIKNNKKLIRCKNCGNVSRWRLKTLKS